MQPLWLRVLGSLLLAWFVDWRLSHVFDRSSAIRAEATCAVRAIDTDAAARATARARQAALAIAQCALDDSITGTGNYNSGSPNLTAIPSIGQQPATFNLNGIQFSGTILAGMTLPLYDGGTRSAVLAQAHAPHCPRTRRLPWPPGHSARHHREATPGRCSGYQYRMSELQGCGAMFGALMANSPQIVEDAPSRRAHIQVGRHLPLILSQIIS